MAIAWFMSVIIGSIIPIFLLQIFDKEEFCITIDNVWCYKNVWVDITELIAAEIGSSYNEGKMLNPTVGLWYSFYMFYNKSELNPEPQPPPTAQYIINPSKD